MVKDLEERLDVIENELSLARSRKNSRRRKLILLLSVATLVTIIISAVAYYKLQKVNQTALPSVIIKQLSFPVYFPQASQLPDSYTYDQGSVNVQSGILFYRISNKDKHILVSQQASPAENIGIRYLVGFDAFETANGTAYVGEQQTGPTALLHTKETLITVSATKDTPKDVVNSLVKILEKVN